MAYLDPQAAALTHMYAATFNDAFNEYAYSATLAGLSYTLLSNNYGLVVGS